ncbi:MAG: hypothetical protein RIR70_1711 [Pseudomonadota bacterium]|jgi:hypothetical protein
MKQLVASDRVRPRARPKQAAADLLKRHEIRFNRTPPEQVTKAAKLLSGLDGLLVSPGPGESSLTVEYSLTEYTLQGLESALAVQGFHLDGSIFAKIMRALVYFCEDTQLHNMRCPERLIKQSHEVYVKAWETHLHGDHDDTPPELREYK